jgi:hypothetical protein
VPKQLIIRDSLPRNPSGKVLKRVLRAELETDAGSLREEYGAQRCEKPVTQGLVEPEGKRT